MDALVSLLRQTISPEARLHALWTLEGLEALDSEQIVQALKDANPRIRENSIRLAETRLSDSTIRETLVGMAGDPSDRVQFQLACTLGSLPAGRSQTALEQLVFRHLEDRWFQIAVLTGSSQSPIHWFRTVVTKAPSSVNSKGREQFIRRITAMIGAKGVDADCSEVLTAAGRSHGKAEDWWRPASLEGLASGLKRAAKGRTKLTSPLQQRVLDLLDRSGPLRRVAFDVAVNLELENSSQLKASLQRATTAARDDEAGLEDRVDALTYLGLDPTGSSFAVLERFLSPKQPEPLQVAAARALLALKDPKLLPLLLERWQTYTAGVREIVLGGLCSKRDLLPILLDAIEAGKIQVWSLSRPRKTQLLRFARDEGGKRSSALLASLAEENRKQVINRYRPALHLNGSAERGEKILQKICSKCHRVGEVGFEVGPDLASLGNRTREELLVQILDPNSYVAPGYEEYAVETTDGQILTGVIARQTATTVILRRSGGEEDTVLRRNIASLRSLTVSQMPEDLERGLSIQDMADLLQFLKNLGTKEPKYGDRLC